MNDSQTVPTNRKFYSGLEYLRIIFILLIVGWHTKVFGQATFYIQPTQINLTNFLYFCFSLLGVPIFLIISQYLYIQNRRKGYLTKRLLLLAVFFIFWNLVAFALFANQLSARDWISFDFIIKGGYGPLYFIFDLIIITFVTELICLCYERFRTKIFVTTMYLTLCLILVYASIIPFVIKPTNSLNNYLLSFQSFVNFLPYAIVAFLISKKTNRNEIKHTDKPKYLSFKFMVAIIFGICISLLEYLIYTKFLPLQNFEQVFPFYNRISLFVLTVTIFCLFLGFNKPINKHLGQAASLTGGVFIVHYVVINILQTQFPSWYAYNATHSVLFFLTILVFSYFFSWMIKMKRII